MKSVSNHNKSCGDHEYTKSLLAVTNVLDGRADLTPAARRVTKKSTFVNPESGLHMSGGMLYFLD